MLSNQLQNLKPFAIVGLMLNLSTHISLIYVGLNVLLLVVLAILVIKTRMKNKVPLGDGGNESVLRAMRIHGNATEYIPVALFLLFLLEVNGAGRVFLHSMGIALTLGRVLHAYGLTKSRGPSIGRFVGTTSTFLCLIVGSIYALIIALDLP